MNLLFCIAIAIVFGFIGGKIAQFFKLPGVVGYLLAGLVFGPSFLHLFHEELLENMNVFASFALSIVAFMIGSEMKISTFRGTGRGIGLITLLESFGAFLLVTGAVYLLTGKLYLALIFGAMAPASAPAGTVAVLQECKAKGRLTNALYAVVGLDDGLAIMIFAVAVAFARMLFVGGTVSVKMLLEGPVIEILGSIALGCVVGLLAGYFTRRLQGKESVFAVTLGAILACTGTAIYFHFSLILANLSLGMVFSNIFPVVNRRAYQAIESITLPIYIVFFFIAGAHLQIGLLPSMGLLGLVYIISRMAGLVGGAFLGATISRQSPAIRKYLGIGILCQAGVAIGLSLIAAGEFRGLGEQGRALAITLVNTIAATTIVFEIIGPIGAKIAVTRAGELGVNITEEDLIETYKVRDVVDEKVSVITAGMSLREIIRIVSDTEKFYYPVVDADKKLIGTVTLGGIRKTFATQELNDWLVALDVMEPFIESTTEESPLSEALGKMKRMDIENLSVLGPEGRLVGVLNQRAVMHLLSAEVLAKQQQAETAYSNLSG